MRTRLSAAACLGFALFSSSAQAGVGTGGLDRPALDGPRKATLDLWRADAGAEKLFVEADLGDGVPRLFLVDTGASISVLAPEVAEALKLKPSGVLGEAVGLGGRVDYREAHVPQLKLGPFRLYEVSFGVGIPGIPERAGSVPVAGILGNNILGKFQFAIDYPANILELYRPGEMKLPADAAPLQFDGSHPRANLTLVGVKDGVTLRQTVAVEVDTGARGLLLAGTALEPLRSIASSGEEPIFGVGAGDELPASNFLRKTRRIPIEHIEFAGQHIEALDYATWINYDARRAGFGPAGLPGLLGHEALSDYRVLFDYHGQRIALLPPLRPERAQESWRWGLRSLPKPEEAAAHREHARLLFAAGKQKTALRYLDRFYRNNPTDYESGVVLARMHRLRGEFEAAQQICSQLSPGQLVDGHEIVGAVNSLWLAGRVADAIQLAQAATNERPESSIAWLANADALRQAGRLDEAREALLRANALDDSPDGHLIRRAWISHLEGDLWGTSTHLGRLLRLYPYSGMTFWFFAESANDTRAEAVLRGELEAAANRLHPNEGPLDFLSAAWRVLGDSDRSLNLAKQGQSRDCARSTNPNSRLNCQAWYLAVSGQDLETARNLLNEALREEPPPAEFLDTLATLRAAEGDLIGAREAALAAAQREPEDIYLLWQVARLDAQIKKSNVTPPGTP
jgi:tetratricopeptide (TPR) repeat protein